MATYQSPGFATADPTAVVGKRIVAAIIDSVILLAIAFGTARGIVDLKQEDTGGIDNACDLIDQAFCFQANDTVYYSDSGGAAGLLYGVPTIVALLNTVVLQGATGASVGKHLLGLRVVKKESGGLAGIGKCFVRWIVGIVDSIPCCFPLVGLIMVITTKGHRRLGDMAAGTLVVGKESVGVAPSIPGVTAGGFAPPAAAWPAPGGGAPPAPQQGWPAQEAAWSQPQQPQQAYPPPAAAPAPAAPPEPTPQPAPQPAPQPQAQPAAAADPTQPQWDAARNAYIQWDPNSNQWMQWDDTNKQWRPIS